MTLNIIQSPSPNYNERPEQFIKKPTHIIIHATEGAYPGDLNWLQRNNKQLSAHYLVNREGVVHQMVQDSKRAWHACNANGFSIGVEHTSKWTGPNNRGLYGGCLSGMKWMTRPQMLASAELVAGLMVKYGIPIINVLGHNDPYLRRFMNNHADPGKDFPWGDYRAAIQEFIKPGVNPQFNMES